MSVFAACGHKAEWIDQRCGKCSVCCKCEGELEPVHINTKEAAIALGRWARRRRTDLLEENDDRGRLDEGSSS